MLIKYILVKNVDEQKKKIDYEKYLKNLHINLILVKLMNIC